MEKPQLNFNDSLSENGVLYAFHGISWVDLWSIPWVFIQVIPILFTFGLCNITSSRYSESNDFRPIYSFFHNFSEYEYYITGGLFLSSLSLYLLLVYDPISWMEKSPRFYRFLKLCNSCLRLLLQIHFFLPLHLHIGDHFKGESFDDVSVKISRVPHRLDIRRLEWQSRGMFDLEWCSSLVWMTK